MLDKNMEQLLNSHGYFCYKITCGFAVADPSDGPDGFYIEGSDKDNLITEAVDHLGLEM